MNNKLRTETKHGEKDFFKLMSNSVSGKTMGNVRKPRDIKLDVSCQSLIFIQKNGSKTVC